MKPKRHDRAAVETRRLGELLPHPSQEAFFDPPTPEGVAALADNIRRIGLRDRIDVMPAGNRAGLAANTIISGHSRKMALERLGMTEAEVVVRYDLRDADAAEVERCLLEANQNRRQLDKLTQARIAKRLFLHEKRATRRRLTSTQQGELRDRIGKIIGMSGRNFIRYFRLLDTPVEVQNAFRRGEVSLVLAEKVADLGSRDQEEIAERIRSGQDAKSVILTHLPPRRKGHVKVADALNSFVKALGRGLEDLSDRVDQVRPAHLGRHAGVLRRAGQLISDLVQKQDGQSNGHPPATVTKRRSTKSD
ncbi:MAG: hypothetical protein LC104_05115 [Bacteroidales bacterium]|nr:hypothetical protein [Bacteroidales bacterium]